MTDADRIENVLGTLRHGPCFRGLFDGEGEQRVVDMLLDQGVIRETYEGVGGFMGLSKLSICNA